MLCCDIKRSFSGCDEATPSMVSTSLLKLGGSVMMGSLHVFESKVLGLMRCSEKVSLNVLANNSTFRLIDGVLSEGYRIREVCVPACSNWHGQRPGHNC